MSEHAQETAANAPGSAVSIKLQGALEGAWSAMGTTLSGPKAVWCSLPPISVSVTRYAGFWSI